MKIISKYKDYYDYLKGIYGEDPKLILDRRDFSYFTDSGFDYIVTMAVCDKLIQGLYCAKEKRMIWGKELDNYMEPVDDSGWIKGYTHRMIGRENKWTDYQNRYLINTIRDCNLNTEYDCPILIVDRRNKINTRFSRLSDMDFHKVYTAEQLWILLSEWLGRRITDKEPTVPIGDDSIRIQSHGFDLKTSFRPKIKSK